MYLANPGANAITVRLYALASGRGRPVTVQVPPGSTALVGTKSGPPLSSVVAVSSDGTFVPAEASYTPRGIGFAVATGVPIPGGWIPRE